MMCKKMNSAGFTLIEIIVVLVIVGIMAAGLSVGLVRGVENFIVAGQATQISQQAQVAMARMKKELTDATAVSTATATQIAYTTASGESYVIDILDGEIRLGPTGATYVLLNSINTGSTTFAFFQNDGVTAWAPGNGFNSLGRIQVNINTNSPALVFQTTINPRKTERLNTPRLN